MRGDLGVDTAGATTPRFVVSCAKPVGFETELVRMGKEGESEVETSDGEEGMSEGRYRRKGVVS